MGFVCNVYRHIILKFLGHIIHLANMESKAINPPLPTRHRSWG